MRPLLVLLDRKLDSNNLQRPGFDLTDFELRQEFGHLMIQLDELNHARIEWMKCVLDFSTQSYFGWLAWPELILERTLPINSSLKRLFWLVVPTGILPALPCLTQL